MKLNFLPLSGIQINLKKNQQTTASSSIFLKPKLFTSTTTTTTTQEFIYTEYYKKERKLVNIDRDEEEEEEEDGDGEKRNDSKKKSDTKHVVEEEMTPLNDDIDLVTVHRHMIFYDGKCRNCMFNVANATLDADLFVEPTFSHSIKCHLKVFRKKVSTLKA